MGDIQMDDGRQKRKLLSSCWSGSQGRSRRSLSRTRIPA